VEFIKQHLAKLQKERLASATMLVEIQLTQVLKERSSLRMNMVLTLLILFIIIEGPINIAIMSHLGITRRSIRRGLVLSKKR